jgi:hypothetical protein
MRMQPCITPSALVIMAEPRSTIQLASTAPLCLNASSEPPSGHADHSADCFLSICGPNFAVEQRAKRGTSAARKERVAAALLSAKALVDAKAEAVAAKLHAMLERQAAGACGASSSAKGETSKR